MTKRKVCVIRGDGIGPAIVDAAVSILEKLDADFVFEYAEAGFAAFEKYGKVLPEKTKSIIVQNEATLKGPITPCLGNDITPLSQLLRERFALYADVRPVMSFRGAKARFEDVDIITVRENTQGLYSSAGQSTSSDGTEAEAISKITKDGAEKISVFAFDLARREGRKKVTIVHKANVLKSTSGLFLKVAREVAERYPDIQAEEMIVDTCCMQLVMNPHLFDVIVTTNLFGDIISDLCAGLVGGLGMAPAANIGDDCAIFEAVHSAAPDLAGKNLANPCSMILAAIQLLEYLRMPTQATRVRDALRDAIESSDRTTRDLGGEHGTSDFTEAVLERLEGSA